MIDKGHISNTKNKNDKMLQATKLMHTICLLNFTFLIIEVATISAVEKIIVNSNVITIAATERSSLIQLR